jgi:hypothetical protein
MIDCGVSAAATCATISVEADTASMYATNRPYSGRRQRCGPSECMTVQQRGASRARRGGVRGQSTHTRAKFRAFKTSPALPPFANSRRSGRMASMMHTQVCKFLSRLAGGALLVGTKYPNTIALFLREAAQESRARPHRS